MPPQATAYQEQHSGYVDATRQSLARIILGQAELLLLACGLRLS
jgi:hypothetical protein